MGKLNFRIVPRMVRQGDWVFDIVLSNGEVRALGEMLMPNDGQLGDDVTAAEEIATALRKRIKKSTR